MYIEAKHKKVMMRLASEDRISLLDMKNEANYKLLWIKIGNNSHNFKHDLLGRHFIKRASRLRGFQGRARIYISVTETDKNEHLTVDGF